MREPVLLHGDCLDIMPTLPANFFQAIITDPPFSSREFEACALQGLRSGNQGVWRQPPRIGGRQRNALPRFFSARENISQEYIKMLQRVSEHVNNLLVPGGHALFAANSCSQHHVASQLELAGLQIRGVFIRPTCTLRGGDKPKGAEKEFSSFSSSPRTRYEPWVLARKAFEGTVADNLRRFGVGALKRLGEGPVVDIVDKVISQRPSKKEHPTQKPTALMQFFAETLAPSKHLPVLDMFAGSGTTGVACINTGRSFIGIEKDKGYFDIASKRIAEAQRQARLAI